MVYNLRFIFIIKKEQRKEEQRKEEQRKEEQRKENLLSKIYKNMSIDVHRYTK